VVERAYQAQPQSLGERVDLAVAEHALVLAELELPGRGGMVADLQKPHQELVADLELLALL
jgi:hypothetical protein